MRYNNYHKHDHYSNIRTLDCVVKPQDYIDRAKELNHTTMFTTQHGWTGNFLEMYDMCQKNNLKMIYGAELYIVKDRFEKDNSNSHIIIVGKNQDAFYQLNEIMSESNKTGFYYKPRIDLKLLLSLNPNNFIITSACVAGILKNEEIQSIFLEPILKHFNKNFYIEVQEHVHQYQANYNQKMLEISNQYGIEIIHANDSHYIYPEDSYKRDMFLKGKGLKYDEEDGFILDYPDYDTILDRYKKQNILSEIQAKEAVKNTLIFDNCEELFFNKEIKMPTIYPNEDSNKKLKSIIVNKWNEEKKNINPKRQKEYIEGIKFEYDIIKKTNMADYFLLNERIIDKAVNEYGGILTRSGRGCFTEDSLIHTKNTIKSIKDIIIGDEVITKDGEFNKVINTMQYDIDEELIQIKHLYGTDKHYPTICTLDHKILINRNNNIDWIEAKNIKKEDYVCVPKIKNTDLLPKYIDLVDYNIFEYEYDEEYIYEYSPYMNNKYKYSPKEVSKILGVGKSIIEKFANGEDNLFQRKTWVKNKFYELFPFKTQDEYVEYIKQKRTKKITRFIKLDKTFNEFIGLMYGDGFAPINRYYTIGLAINSISEKDKINRNIFEEIANRLNIDIYEYKSKNKNLIQLCINSNIFSNFIRNDLFISKKYKEKQFNPKWFNQNKENLSGLLNGLKLSDGCDKEKYRLSFDNTSKSIINAYKILCLMTNEGVNSLIIRPKWKDINNYKCKESYKLRINPNAEHSFKKSERILSDNNYWYLPIKEIKLLPKTKTKVYDITVQNQHNYLINNMIVHNSAVSFYINKLLGFTEIDRFESEVPLYPTRFMTVSRILESKSLPDIDYNWADVEPAIKASKDILGEDNVYYMYAIGFMKESSAFRNLCRAYGLSMDQFNEVAKELDKYTKDPQWKDLIEESKMFQGVIESISPSPCSFVMLNKPISKELGLIKIGDQICACIDGYTSDVWKYLKNDFLTVRVWKIISDTFKLLNKPIPNIKELKQLLDEKVWNLYKDGLTATLNQVDTDISTALVKRYCPSNVAEISGFVAAIRPGFASLLNTFLNRQEYSTGVDEIDEILKPSYHFMLYQESIMAFLVWCGLKEDHTYDIIKMIAKKKFKEEELIKLKQELRIGFINNVGNDERFEDLWEIIENAVSYAFNASHSLSVAWDSLYGAYLKANYPLEYYTIILNEYESDSEKTHKITLELPYFDIKLSDIKFGKSTDTYSFERESKTIYKSVSSIKFLNSQVGIDLYQLAKENIYTNYIDIIKNIKEKTSTNSRQLRILTGLNFFSEYGKNKKLLEILEIYEQIGESKQIKKEKAEKIGLNIDILLKHTQKITDKIYKDIDIISYIKEFSELIENKTLSVKEEVKFQVEFLEYTTVKYEQADSSLYIITEYKCYKDKSKPYITLRNLKTGEELKTKVKNSKYFVENSFKLFDILQITNFKIQKKMKNVGGKWERSNEDEQILDEWMVY